MQWSDVIGEERRGNVLGVDQRAKGTYAAGGGVARKCTGMRERARVWTCIEQVERGLWVVRGKRFGVSQKEQALHEQRARGRREAGSGEETPSVCGGARRRTRNMAKKMPSRIPRSHHGSSALSSASDITPNNSDAARDRERRLCGTRGSGRLPRYVWCCGAVWQAFPGVETEFNQPSTMALCRAHVRTCESQENELNQFRKC